MFRLILNTLSTRQLSMLVVLVSCITANARAQQAATAMTDRVLEVRGDSLWQSDRLGSLPYYQELVRRDTSNARAVMRLATLLSYQHDYDESLRLFKRYAVLAPADPDGPAGTIRVSRWRAFDQPSLEPSAIYTTDSDHNTAFYTAARAGARAGDWRITQTASRSSVNDPASSGVSLHVSTIGEFETDAYSVRLEGGIERGEQAGSGVGSANARVSHVVPIAAARIAAQLSDKLHLGGSASYLPFDETSRLVRSRASALDAGPDVDVAFSDALHVSAAASLGNVRSDSGSNRRIMANAEIGQRVAAPVVLGIDARGTSYQHFAPDYFAPQRLVIAETFARFATTPDVGWGIEAEAALGSQSVRFLGATHRSFANRAAATVRFRPGLATELSLGARYANSVSSSTQRADGYRGYAVVFGARLHL